MKEEEIQSIRDEKLELETYLQWRGWDIEGVLNDYELGDDLVQSAVGLLSHPLTFPLTLGRHAKGLLPQFSQINDNERGRERNLRLCCVGARAECTLPDDFWTEFLIATRMLSNENLDNEDRPCEQPFNCIIDFIGPDVPSHLPSKTIRLLDQDGYPQQQHPEYQLTMNYHTSFLHEVILKFIKSSDGTKSGNGPSRPEKIRQFWDAFVLFNPGLGHPNLEKQWELTIKFLVETGKPILFTAHSSMDAERDRSILEGLLVGSDRDEHNSGSVQYRRNPYASRMVFSDPFSSQALTPRDKVHIVRPNHSTFLLQS